MALPISVVSPKLPCKISGRYYPSMTNNIESPHLINTGVLFLKITAYSDMTQNQSIVSHN